MSCIGVGPGRIKTSCARCFARPRHEPPTPRASKNSTPNIGATAASGLRGRPTRRRVSPMRDDHAAVQDLAVSPTRDRVLTRRLTRCRSGRAVGSLPVEEGQAPAGADAWTCPAFARLLMPPWMLTRQPGWRGMTGLFQPISRRGQSRGAGGVCLCCSITVFGLIFPRRGPADHRTSFLPRRVPRITPIDVPRRYAGRVQHRGQQSVRAAGF